MKSFTTLMGTILIILGIVTLAYQRFSYTTKENVTELRVPAVGELQVTETKEKTFVIPTYASATSIAAGIILIILGASMRKR